MTEQVLGFEARIAPELASFARPITDATRHPDNIRKHRIDKIAQSLRAHGQRAAIVVQKSTGYIVKGNGTHEAAELLGWTEIAQIWQEMTDAEAIGFLYADNKASDFSTYDRDKTVAGLQKLIAGPGLFDSLWEIEELEDLIEATSEPTILPAQGTEGSIVQSVAGAKIGEAAPPPERMKEIPLILTLKDHAAFVEQVRLLAKQYGTSGTIATIVEAVRREAEGGIAVTMVEATRTTEDERHDIRRELVVELRDYFLSLGEGPVDPAFVKATLEKAEPYRAPVAVEAPLAGQTALDDLVDIGPGTDFKPLATVTAGAGQPLVIEGSSEDDVEALQMLARIRGK